MPKQPEAVVVTLTRLQPKMVFEMEAGEEYQVLRVNDCRAHCVPLTKKRVEIKDQLNGKVVVFEKTGNPIDISPNSDVKILRWER